jgi:uncharacterized membrane protein
VAAAFDHKVQIVFAGEVHGRGNVLGISYSYRVYAWLRGPRIDRT